jgi:hypothetical protein
MKDAVRRLLDQVRGRAGPGVRSQLAQLDEPSLPIQGAGTTGLTVFDDIALRLRSLTAEELDTSHGDPGAIPGAFKIRLAGNRANAKDAGALIERRYASRGYQTKTQSADPHLFTFVGYDEGKVVGTVSIRLDSEQGLGADSLYKAEIDELRTEGCTICEFTRLAIDERAISKPVLAGLFHTAYLYAAHVRGIEFAVIEVNPRHVVFYRKALGFEPIGPERMNTRVQAPAILLCVPFTTIAEGLSEYAGNPQAPGANRSLFTYGFSADEEKGILRRLRALEKSGRAR